MKTKYTGYSNQVRNAVIATSTGHYGIKGIIVIDEDIPADDRVAVGGRYPYVTSPTALWTSLREDALRVFAPAALEVTPRIILDATMPYE